MKRLLTVLLALALLLSACSGATDAAQSGPAATEPEEQALTVGYTPFSGQFSPFYAQSINDWEAVELTQITLLTTGRSGAVVYQGISGETHAWNGNDYTYYGPADLTVTEQEDGTVWYDFTLREDLAFSDGTPVTVDDLIFSLYVLCDPNYTGPSRLNTMPIAGLPEYRAGGADSISGIQRRGDHALRVVTDTADVRTIYYLASVCITPMHYYGDATLYDYESNSFGFPKGDLSGVQAKTGQPMGAGPYRFLEYSGGVIQYEANDSYYLGAPKTRYVRLVQIPDSDRTRRNDGLCSGELDISYFEAGSTSLTRSQKQALEDGTLTMRTVNARRDNQYYYIGLNPARMNVDGDPSSEASRNLRRGFAVIFAACRQLGLEGAQAAGYSDLYQMADYPLSASTWAVPGSADPDDQIAYAGAVDGTGIYTGAMTPQERISAALEAALGYFHAAGYTVEQEHLAAAPVGAALEYELAYYGDAMASEAEADAICQTVYAARDALARIGITLRLVNIYELEDTAQSYWNDCDMRQDFWNLKDTAGVWTAVGAQPELFYRVDPDPNLRASGDSAPESDAVWKIDVYGLADPELEELLSAACAATDQNLRREYYTRYLDLFMDWACEVPLFQTQDSLLFSSKRINTATMTPDITGTYGWMREIHNIELNQGSRRQT